MSVAQELFDKNGWSGKNPCNSMEHCIYAITEESGRYSGCEAEPSGECISYHIGDGNQVRDFHSTSTLIISETCTVVLRRATPDYELWES